MLSVIASVAASASYTTVVGVTTADSVLVGADSKISRDGMPGVGQLCKIITVGNVAVAGAGHLADTATSFNG